MALPCAHIFCQRCITDWLSRHRSCPICQMNPDDQDLLMTLLASEFDQPASAPNLKPMGPLAGAAAAAPSTPQPNGKSRLNPNVPFQIARPSTSPRPPPTLDTGPDYDEKIDPFDVSPNRTRQQNRRSSYHALANEYEQCALCQGPVKPGRNTVSHDCGHTFHRRCAKASGDRSDRKGGCPFCVGPAAKWQFRKHSRWHDLPPAVCRRLDAQGRRRPGTDVVVHQQRLLEIDVRNKTVRDITTSPARTYRLRRQKPIPPAQKKEGCLVM